MKILHAIQQLLKWKQTATIAEIAKIAELKQGRVLEVLNNNIRWIKQDTKGKVIGLRENAQVLKNPDVLYYYYEGINYSADKRIIANKEDMVKDLYQDYWCGGIGDCYRINILLLNDENIKILHERGFVHYDELPKKTFEEIWCE